MSLSANALTTVAALSLDASISTADKETAIEVASDIIRSATGRDFIKQTFTEVYRGNGTQRLTLNNYPILSVTSLSIDDEDITVSDLRILTDGILEYEDGWFVDSGYHDIEIEYSAGYILSPGVGETRSMPYDLEWACRVLAEKLYESGYTRGTSEQYDMPAIVSDVITKYMRVVCG